MTSFLIRRHWALLLSAGCTVALLGALIFAPAVSAKKRKRKKRVTGEQVCATFGAGPAHTLLGKNAKMDASRYVPMCSFSVRLPNADALEEAYGKATMKHMMANMKARQRGEKVERLPRPHVANTVSVTFQGDQKSVEAAIARMKSARSMMQKGITVSTSGSRNGGFRSKVAVGKGKAKATAETDKLTDDAVETINEDLRKAGVKKGARQMGGDKNVSASFTAQSAVEILKPPKGVDEAHYTEKYRNVMARKGKRIIIVEVRLGKTPEEEKELALALATEWLNK